MNIKMYRVNIHVHEHDQVNVHVHVYVLVLVPDRKKDENIVRSPTPAPQLTVNSANATVDCQLPGLAITVIIEVKIYISLFIQPISIQKFKIKYVDIGNKGGTMALRLMY
jgi:hypothetical protein